ncbi:tctex1 domain-containing protein 1-like [Esox lucius]|uniref:Tctex1 domain containing 4 n=1 Tax=Esox lucius TaxID=8010 RepID=A0AAY5JWA4_ESOLU|nr:tctex1 domain-containing protein 1-like [Esox lucius]
MEKSKEAAKHSQGRKGSSTSTKESQEKVPLGDPVLPCRLSFRPAAPRQANTQALRPGLFSMQGLLAAQKFSRGLKERVAQKIGASKVLARKLTVIVNEQVSAGSAEPTERFPSGLAGQLLQDLLWSRLEAVASSAACCGSVVKALSEEARALLRTVCPPRYRLVCTVTLVQLSPEGQQGKGLILASRCLWDPHADKGVSYTHQSQQMCCTANVFAVYYE